MNGNPARVLLVEDNDETRELLAATLRGAGYVVQSEANGTSAAHHAAMFRPDIALLDLNLADGLDGLTVARRLRASNDVPVLFVTAASAAEDRLAGFEAGADDYIVKPVMIAELMARMTAVLRRSGRLRSSTVQVGDLVIDEDAHTVSRGSAVLNLTSVEFSLLLTLCRHPGRVFSKVQLLSDIWGFEQFDVNLVEVYVSSLRRKLEQHGPRLIHTIRSVGYVVRA